MTMLDIIAKKRDGEMLTDSEIAFVVDGFTAGEIPDYQMSALLMAIYLQGMTREETLALTTAMVNSGDTIDLSSVSGVKADKHSTGGVGDKTSLILCPMVAALGVKMAKMSGRGLGHTGGTIDKLESIPGFSCDISMEEFLDIVNRVGFVIAGQTGELTPADKKIYALRDVTATVASRPLIVSSIMSKKLAAGADVIVLDVKTGSGSFMRDEQDAFDTAGAMVEVGRLAGRKVVAVVTDMDEPLGCAVGNALEVKEAISVLSGESIGHLRELCLELGAQILLEGGIAPTAEEAKVKLAKTIEDGIALAKLAELVKAQGGDERAIYDVSLLPSAPVVADTPSARAGYVRSIVADAVGRVSLFLGGGRLTKDSEIDLSVGIILNKKVGDYVEAGESLAFIHASDPVKAAEAAAMLRDCYVLTDTKPELRPFIKGIVR